MELRSTLYIFLLLFSVLLATSSPGVAGEAEDGEHLEAQCRPYVEQALKKLETGDMPTVDEVDDTSEEIDESRTETEPQIEDDGQASEEEKSTEQDEAIKDESQKTDANIDDESKEHAETEETEDETSKEAEGETEKSGEEHDTSAETEAVEESHEATESEKSGEGEEHEQHDETSTEQADEPAAASGEETSKQAEGSEEEAAADDDSKEVEEESKEDSGDKTSAEQQDQDKSGEAKENASEEKDEQASSKEDGEEVKSQEATDDISAEKEDEGEHSEEEKSGEHKDVEDQSAEQVETSKEVQDEAGGKSEEKTETSAEKTEDTSTEQEAEGSVEQEDEKSTEDKEESQEVKEDESKEQTEDGSQEHKQGESGEQQDTDSQEHKEESQDTDSQEHKEESQDIDSQEHKEESQEQKDEDSQEQKDVDSKEHEEQSEKSQKEAETDASEEKSGHSDEKNDESGEEVTEHTDASAEEQKEEEAKSGEVEASSKEEVHTEAEESSEAPSSTETSDEQAEKTNATSETLPEEDLMQAFVIPTNLRSRSHISQLLHLDDESNQVEKVINKAADGILKDLKRIYENAIKPLETLYKYRDLSNRHFGDPEIFSKPLVLFMGPWSGGKSSIINYLLDNEYTATSLRTGAEPSPAYFNILMWGEQPEMLDGTQLAADWTFSGLQKFGQGLEERLKGLKLPNKLLEKVNIVEIPGILEVRKQVSRVFPFNDACQWFIDRADIIFLVYDPSKLDVGPETEAILDQLKGREYQTRILLNKADQVKSEELMRVQGALIWNISPLMSSAQPPVMYLTSLWSRPYEEGAPARLLHAQERAFLRDIKSAIDKRIENKISSARRFAVRVRNHAKMVDCYLTTYYNHKSVFANRKLVADQIIEHPQDYHIYEGLSTLTNISRYDLPDPDVYRDFFRLNPLYEFQQLAATCTYFRGCPINRLDIAIAYDFPELVGKYKKTVEAGTANIKSSDNS